MVSLRFYQLYFKVPFSQHTLPDVETLFSEMLYVVKVEEVLLNIINEPQLNVLCDVD
jgi:hypothetical protein